MKQLKEYLIPDINNVESEDTISNDIIAATTITKTGSHVVYIRGDQFTKIIKFLINSSIYSKFYNNSTLLKKAINKVQYELTGERKNKYVQIYIPDIDHAPQVSCINYNTITNSYHRPEYVEVKKYDKFDYDIDIIKDFINKKN